MRSASKGGALVEVAPTGRDDEEHEADRERQAAEGHTCAPAEGRHAAEHQEDAADRAGQETELGEPESRVSLDGERQECHATNDRGGGGQEANEELDERSCCEEEVCANSAGRGTFLAGDNDRCTIQMNAPTRPATSNELLERRQEQHPCTATSSSGSISCFPRGLSR